MQLCMVLVIGLIKHFHGQLYLGFLKGAGFKPGVLEVIDDESGQSTEEDSHGRRSQD